MNKIQKHSLKDLIESIEKTIKYNSSYTYKIAYVDGEYNLRVRNKAGKIYKKYYDYVYHRISSEGGYELGDPKTVFIFSYREVPNLRNYTKVEGRL